MAEGNSGGMGGWVKAGLASVFSLVSGAVLMYVSPLVNNVIKPSKPVANFAFHGEGMAVTFDNRSSGGSEGWWDFGDGTALEAFVPGQQTIGHTYNRAGVFSVKLSLRNFLGDENERTVSVPVDTSGTKQPVIDDFQVVRLNSDNAAPAVFRLLGKVKNAELAIWSLGDDRPLEVNADPGPQLDRLVTIKDAGYYTLRLVAVNEKQTAEKSEVVWVAMPEEGAAGATLQVTYDAVHVRKHEKMHNVAVSFPAKTAESTHKFVVERPADPGFEIVKADLTKAVNDAQVRNFRLEVTSDKTKVRLSGELVKSAAPTWSTQVRLSQEMRSALTKRNMEPIPVALKVPGTTVVPVPPLPVNWEARHKNLNLELRDGNQVVWRGMQLPVNQAVQFKNRPYRLTATESGDQIRLDVVEIKTGVRQAGY